MRPLSVLQIALGVPALRELHLIDVYQHSIWGPMMRMDDLEGSILAPEDMRNASKDDCLQRLREVVSCAVSTVVSRGSERL